MKRLHVVYLVPDSFEVQNLVDVSGSINYDLGYGEVVIRPYNIFLQEPADATVSLQYCGKEDLIQEAAKAWCKPQDEAIIKALDAKA